MLALASLQPGLFVRNVPVGWIYGFQKQGMCLEYNIFFRERTAIMYGGRSQKGLNNRVDKSKLTPIQTQLNVKYQSYVMADVCYEYFIEPCVICKDL